MDPGLPQWLTSAGVIGTLILVLGLWIRGTLLRAKDCDARVQELKESHTRELALIRDAHADQLTALNLAHDNRVKMLTQRLDAVVADRDAWRQAHSDEAEARRVGEHVNSQLMESTNVTMALLSALRESLTRPPSDDHEKG